jgi:recombination protein RecT
MTDLVTFKRNMTDLIERKELALPSNVSSEAFRNAAVIAVQDNPQILDCEQASVFKSIRRLAASGLVPDGREAALVPFNTKENGNYVKKCQAMPMVFGLIKMVRRSGEVTDIRAHLVYDAEIKQGRFDYVIGDRESLTHNPILFGDRGPAVAAYAIANLKDGTIVREFMSMEDIEKVRKAGASQKIYRKGERPTASNEPIGIWKDWFEEMVKKTVIRRICKRLDMSSEDMRRVIESEPDYDHMRDVTPEQKEPSRLQKMAQEARQKDVENEQESEEQPLEGEIMPDSADDGSFEFSEGATAARNGTGINKCPYDSGQQQVDWLAGWNSEKGQD